MATVHVNGAAKPIEAEGATPDRGSSYQKSRFTGETVPAALQYRLVSAANHMG
jgi:hypothetical protein